MVNEKKPGFFSGFKGNVARTGSSKSGLLRRKKNLNPVTEPFITRSQSMSVIGETLAPLVEGPDPNVFQNDEPKKVGSGLGHWMKEHLSRSSSMSASSCKSSDLRLLLGVMGTPLAPVHVSATDPFPHLSIKDTPIETSSAQYILQQYIAASGGQKLQNSIKNSYAMGKVRMVSYEFETASRIVKNWNASKCAESGGFVLWQMNPDKWYVELAVGRSKVQAGCNGKLVWRHTPLLGAQTAKGPVRPLRRAIQGLDPRTTASIFANAKCIGEKNINGENCFTLKLSTDPETLKARGEGPSEIIRHVLLGYFSQKTGLLVHIEDSHLTRNQSNGGDTVYWETTINSDLYDYRPVDGIMVAHSGHSVATLYRFGETAMSHTKTKIEETWTIDEVAFNVPGLSVDCFIPPADLRTDSASEGCELPQDERGKNSLAVHWAKVIAQEKSHNLDIENMFWRMEI
ncbi:hypothetical protein TanjilG_20538 [Lupinus angustifolius]|uniref:Uncharacterized protein n=1 Tax=Lupinus angustifolius TaxID=3871 RepID=A0A1J7HAD7_LUPAN|nr:PREDICTED: uncharacterized protein LOC109349987 [Lupinus angustifolius]OIW09831.1 hypothetical protein TanjilG_20538 [Lupinus angustifolius]